MCRTSRDPSIDRSALDDPLGRLPGHECDVVEVCVVVQDRERLCFGDCCDEEIRNLASLETVGGQLSLDLLRALPLSQSVRLAPLRLVVTVAAVAVGTAAHVATPSMKTAGWQDAGTYK